MSKIRCAATALAMLAAFPAAAETLTFAPLPMETPETVVKQVKPMLAYLEQQLGIDIKIEFSADYSEILNKFKNGGIDLAYLGPLPYLTLRDQYADAQPLIHFKEKSGKASYTCAVVAPADAIPDLKTLKGAAVALTQSLSTCGYLSTDGLLQAAGSNLERNKYRYLGKHDEVALAVTRGEFALGGLKTAIGRKYAHLGLKIIAETAPLPGFALVANSKTVNPELMNRIRDVMTALAPTQTANDPLLTWGDNIRYGAVAAFDNDYDSLRRLRKTATIPEKGNF